MRRFSTGRGRRKWVGRALVGAGVLAAACVSSGCANAGEGAASGALLGFGVGSIIGSTCGDFGAGALIGSAIGAAGGAVVGDQNARADARARYYAGHSDVGYYGERGAYYAPAAGPAERVIIVRDGGHGRYYRDPCSDW